MGLPPRLRGAGGLGQSRREGVPAFHSGLGTQSRLVQFKIAVDQGQHLKQGHLQARHVRTQEGPRGHVLEGFRTGTGGWIGPGVPGEPALQRVEANPFGRFRSRSHPRRFQKRIWILTSRTKPRNR